MFVISFNSLYTNKIISIFENRQSDFDFSALDDYSELLPIIFICKNMILKFDTTKRKTNILRVSIVLLIVYFGVLYRLIGYVAVQIPLLKSFLINKS